MQVAHFTTPSCFDDLEPLHTSLNGILPPDIRIREVSSVQPDFHARYSACRKTYQYKAYVSPVMDPFQHDYACHIRNHVNVAAMQEAASSFLGLRNFSAFANHSADPASRDLLRELLSFYRLLHSMHHFPAPVLISTISIFCFVISVFFSMILASLLISVVMKQTVLDIIRLILHLHECSLPY
jgi:hypothetical protein